MSVFIPELRLAGHVAYDVQDGRVQISIDSIVSDRAADNLSGTLSLELWALPAPYAGTGFSGCPLAAVQIGELYGQHMLSGCHYDLLFTPPASGLWQLCLMLREWNGTLFETRDYVNFAIPFRQEAAQPLLLNELTDDDAQPDNGLTAGLEDESPADDGQENEEADVTVMADIPSPAPKRVKKNTAKKSAKEKPVSVNSASRKKLSKIKGVPEKLAELIIAGRPYSQMDDLLRVKGIGPKKLEKIRERLCL